MKKFMLLLLLIAPPCEAYQISVGTISADATSSGFNDSFQTITNVINGNLEGSSDGGASVSNIKAASVYQINMADDANGRVRDKELLTNTVDVFSSGTLQQNTFVFSGCTPATDVTLTSAISACVAYINGYRVSKGATSETYAANMDTYVDISQTGVYTLTTVASGATQPSVASNSARLAKVVTSGTAITSVTDLARRSLAGLVVPSNYRSGLVVSRDSATTITVFPGTAEIASTMVPKTSTTTLTLTTAGDWAGGVSLRAANTYGFVGEDASGNLKLHTTAPTHTNYAVSTTVGKKRFATWSSVVYRILGWFYMDAAQTIENASNIKEGDVSNSIISNDNTVATFTSTAYTDVMGVHFYSSGGNSLLFSVISSDLTGITVTAIDDIFNYQGTDIPISSKSNGAGSAGQVTTSTTDIFLHQNVPQQGATYKVRRQIGSGTINLRSRTFIVRED